MRPTGNCDQLNVPADYVCFRKYYLLHERNKLLTTIRVYRYRWPIKA